MSKKTFLILPGSMVLLGMAFLSPGIGQTASTSAGSEPGVVFEIEIKENERSSPRTMEVKVQSHKIARDILPDKDGRGKGKFIFRGDRGENGDVVVVDDDRKTYYIMDDATIRAIAGQLGAVTSELEKGIKNLPKEQREAIERATREEKKDTKLRSKTVIKKTGERAEKQGYPCVKYEVFRDGRKVREIWVTDWENIDGGEETAYAMLSMSAFFDVILATMGDQDPNVFNNPYAGMNFEDGFPVVVREFYENGGLDSESKLMLVQRQMLDPDEFEPPSGYKLGTMGPQN